MHRAVWNAGNGLANAPWLASATASGLCRVDWLAGRWLRDYVPYEGVEGIRCEREVQAGAEAAQTSAVQQQLEQEAEARRQRTSESRQGPVS